MPVIRTYGCDDCGATFEVTQAMDDGAPDCPNCSRVLEWQPGGFNIIGTKAKAIDVTQDILEKDFGLTNFRDNQRQGDVAAITEAPSSQKRDAEIRQLSEVAQATGAPPLTQQQAEMAQNYWGGGASPIMPQVSAADMLSGAKMSTAAANAEGVNPMQLLHQAGKQGKLKTPINVIARA